MRSFLMSGICLLYAPPGGISFNQYLSEKGIQTLIHYPIPPHQQLAYKQWNELSYPETEAISAEVLSLPMSPLLTEGEVEEIIKTINAFNL